MVTRTGYGRTWTADRRSFVDQRCRPARTEGSTMAEPQATTSAPIILVPGFWLGAWAWDEVAEILRADGHDVTALTLPGLESAETDRSGITLADHVDAIVNAVGAADAPGRPRRPQRQRLLGIRGERSHPREDRGDGLRRHRSRQGRPGPGLQGRREADGLGGDRGGGEPRRAQRGAEGDVPPAGGPGPRQRAP